MNFFSHVNKHRLLVFSLSFGAKWVPVFSHVRAWRIYREAQRRSPGFVFCGLIGDQQSAFFVLSVCLSVCVNMPPKKERCTMFCPFCGQGFGGQVSAYMRHMRSHYNTTPRLRVCHYCGYSPKVEKAAWGLDHRHECKVKPEDMPDKIGRASCRERV